MQQRTQQTLQLEAREWKAILPDGTLVAPGTAGTLKIDIVSGVPKISTTVKTTTSGDQWPSTPFKDLAVESGITIPDILKALAVFPSDNRRSWRG